LNKELIDAYAAGADKLAMAIRGLSPEDMASKPPADAKVGKWSIRQLLVHLADADGVLADRMKRMIAEDNPQLLAYDENRWMAALAYEQQSAEDGLTLFRAIRHQMSVILRHVPEAAWQRTGIHSEVGKMTLTQLLERANKHLDHHLEFIHAKRRLMGKEMW
jgi:uncharacterized damage-inducible protein DinB